MLYDYNAPSCDNNNRDKVILHNIIIICVGSGAKMVFIGQPQAWGSIYNGTAGVLNVLDILHKEFVNTAMLSGTPDLASITRDMIVNPYMNN